jgi:nucleotide-binding universal stress UspA family protein
MHSNDDVQPRLVVGVDFSDPCAGALVEAKRLADMLDAQLCLIHVLPEPLVGVWRPDATAAAWLRTMSVGLGEIVLRQGRAWAELARAASEVEATALVVGTHGASGYQPISLGSTARRVSLLAACPVVLVGSWHQTRRTRGPLRAAGEVNPLMGLSVTALRLTGDGRPKPGE